MASWQVSFQHLRPTFRLTNQKQRHLHKRGCVTRFCAVDGQDRRLFFVICNMTFFFFDHARWQRHIFSTLRTRVRSDLLFMSNSCSLLLLSFHPASVTWKHCLQESLTFHGQVKLRTLIIASVERWMLITRIILPLCVYSGRYFFGLLPLSLRIAVLCGVAGRLLDEHRWKVVVYYLDLQRE